MRRWSLATLVLVVALAGAAWADDAAPKDGAEAPPRKATHPWLQGLSWRCIGPARGGRVSSVAGVRGDRNTYYMGACGGGVWKTTDAGHRWRNVTDSFFKTGSVGAIAVAPSDANIVYVGMGEPDPRGNFSHGDGVYRTTDAGKTWKHLGLADTRQIGRIVVHPSDPDVVYVAALGHVWGPNKERGVYRSRDGGATWKLVHYVSQDAGAIDLCIDPFSPRTLFAGFWQVRRKPWRLDSGGKGSGLWRSDDAGDTWRRVRGGLPQGVTGKTCVSCSAAQRGRVYAMVEAKEGGLFRSDDGGHKWQRVNRERKLRQRAWYYSRVEADPQDPNTVYVLNVRFHRSKDGGKTFRPVRTPHVDNHALWIDPDDNQRMVEGNDGGANVSFDGGRTWSRQDNQPTAQFYRVTTDTRYPYRVLGSQQDNTTLSIAHTSNAGNGRDFYAVGGGESGYIAVRPDNPDIIFGGSYAGYLTRYDHETQLTRNISPWPENVIGHGCADHTHRFQWTFPVVHSPHDPGTLYVGAEVLFRSKDDGETWEAISPDLTTNDKKKQASSGGPITQDNTTVEYFCTIFTVAESPRKAGRIWVGTDDGRVHVTDDVSKGWDEITPPNLGDDALISLVEPSPHDSDAAFLAVTRYRSDDFRPYVFHTRDRGKTWTKIVQGIPETAFVRSLREDPKRPGLLYAATETGMIVSMDAGSHWHAMQLNLPVVPVTDVAVKGDDLVISTQGRSFWILTGLSRLRQLPVDADLPVLLAPEPAVWGQSAKVHVHVRQEATGKSRLTVHAKDGTAVRQIPIVLPGAQGANRAAAGKKDEADDARSDEDDDRARRRRRRGQEGKPVRVKRGMNLIRVRLRRKPPTKVPGAVGWPGVWGGPPLPPGDYTVRLRLGDQGWDQPLTIVPDPRWSPISPKDQASANEYVDAVYDALDRVHRGVNEVRDLRTQVRATMKQAQRAGVAKKLKTPADALLKALKAVEDAFIQSKSKAPQDPLNFPVRLNDKLAQLLNRTGRFPLPTQAMRKVLAHHQGQLDAHAQTLTKIRATLVPAFNEAAANAPVPALVLPKAPKK